VEFPIPLTVLSILEKDKDSDNETGQGTLMGLGRGIEVNTREKIV
jgi:hypothetical protein